MHLDDHSYEPDEEPQLQEQLQEIKPAYELTPEIEHSPSLEELPKSPRGISPRQDPGLPVLFAPGHFHFHTQELDSSPDTVSNGSLAMTDQAGGGQATPEDVLASGHGALIDSRLVDAKALGEQAAAALATEATTHARSNSREPAKRVDSAHDEVPQSTSVKQSRSGRATPLKLHTGGPVSSSGSDDTITTSPRLERHVIPVEEGNVGTLPALQQPTSPTAHGVAASPQSERLPSFQHINQLADAAQHANRVPQYAHHHSQSFGSATAQSPILPYHIAPNPQMSPSSQYTFSARSPTSTMGEHYSSPTQHPGHAYYAERRTSAIHEHPMGFPPSLPSASSSGESHGPLSSTDGYSTAHTTPIDSALLPDGIHRNMPILPPPRGMQPQNPALLIGGFQCDYPACEAPPFATQYLLSSHKNVHSSARPHYCPVEGCPRSEGGKGFKRKNEMIRHGLVHNSPGYICPFCPEREHKYPRPDNLQRHVRVHHAEKKGDDAQLREVLNQRTEGLGKTRRKRANTGPS